MIPRSNPIIAPVLLALAYFVTGRLGLMLPAVGTNITLIWLPTGIAVAALVRYGYGCWPGVALGAAAVNFAIGTPLPVALGIAVGNTLGPLLAALALRRMGFHPAFDRKRDILILAVAAILGMLVSASLGVISLSLAGAVPVGRTAAWLIWWAGDTMGVITGAPLVFAFTRKEIRAILFRRAESAAWLCATVAVSWGVFVLNRDSTGGAWALAFVPLPMVAWAALRSGPAGTSVALIVISVIAAYGTGTGHGPFYRQQPIEGVMVLWIFMATAAALGWLISALHLARVHATGIQRLFEQALTDVSLGVLLAGLDRRITFANEGFTRLTGYAETELLGKSCSLLQGADTDPAMVRKLKSALQGDGYFDGEILNYRKDGTPFWNALLISPVNDEHGVKTGFLGIQRDITKRKHAELALHQSEEHLRTIIALEPECVKLLSPEGKLLDMNPAGLEMIEADSLDEVRGQLMSDLIIPEDRRKFLLTHRRALNGETVRCEFSVKGLRGTRRTLETSIVPYRDARREIVGVLGITRDITQRKEAELSLQESEERFRRLIDFAPEAIMLLDVASGRLVQVNPAAERLFGRSAAELGRVGPAELSPPMQPDGRLSSEKAAEFVSQAIAGETPIFEWTHRAAEGRDIPCEVRLLRIEIGGRVVVRGSTTDITGRKMAEAALRESEVRYRELFDANPHPMWVYDVESLRFLAVNAAAVAHYGYSREEFLAMTIRDIRPPEDIPALLASVGAAVRGIEEAGVWRHRRRDGTLIAVEISSHQLAFDGHHAKVVLAHDVTERQRAEARSAGERAVLELLATGAPLPAVLDRLARSYEEIFPGMLCSVLLLDADRQHLRHAAAPSLPVAFCQAVDGIEIGPHAGSCGTAAFTRQTTLVADIATDPLWRDYRDLALANDVRACWSVPVISSHNRVLGTLALYYRQPSSPRPEEVSMIERGAHFASLAIERHELLGSLQESKVRLETLVSNLPGMAYRCQNDPDWTMTYVSDSCEAITGYRRDEIEGNRVVAYADLIHPDDRDALWAKCQKSLDARTPCQNEYRILDRQGRARWVSERASGVHAPDGALLFIDGFIQDITAARHAKTEREQLDRKMQETQKLESLGVLAGGIAHDFNNLLTTILGNASLASMDLPQASPTLECLTQITEASMRAADLCKQMLAYSGRGRFVVQTIDLGELVEHTAQMLQISISKKSVLRFRLEKKLPAVEVDATQIRQVIMNLVINASEAIGDESGVISISTGLTRVDRAYLAETLMDPDLPEGEYVFIEVSDTGSGMSPETKARIFDPFFTTKFTGRGLGLAAVLGIVRGHKGAMKVYSELGRGTTFKLLFPAASGVCEISSAATPSADVLWHGTGTVLVVDDEETMRSTVARMMRRLGMEPVLVCDGREAVEVFRAEPDRFALVLLDLTMPHMDGEQTFSELRRLRPDVRVVLMSGFNAQEAVVRFTGKGLASFLQKPFAFAELRDVLRSVLG